MRLDINFGDLFEIKNLDTSHSFSNVFSKLGIKKLPNLVWNSITWIYWEIKKIVHRYLILFFITFVISHNFLFNDPAGLNVFHLHCALVVLAFVAIFLGNRSAIQTFFICAGFFFSMMCYGTNDILHCFLNTFNDNIFNTYSAETIILISIGILPVLLKFFTYLVSEKASKMLLWDLYPERRNTYYAITRYLSNHSILAIDSPYGNGKTTMVEILKNENKKWNFITIGILSTTVENVEFCIVREINRVLESKGVFLNPISKIKTFFSNDFTFCIGDFLFEDQSYEEQIKDFVSGIQRLKKVIVLNFEDIDRITDKEHLNKIFSICDTLTKYELKYKKQYIKIIYQCNIDALDKLYEKDYGYRYVEKFIPQSFSIEALTGDFFKYVLKKNTTKYDVIDDVNFDFLNIQVKQDLLQQDMYLQLNGHTVRGIERILDKVNFVFKTFDFVSIKEKLDKEIVVIFYLTKYFYPYIYSSLEKGNTMDRQKLFYCFFNNGDDEKISLIELRERVKSSGGRDVIVINEFFDKTKNKKAKENYDALLFLTFLGYDEEYYHCQEIVHDIELIDNLGGDISSDNDKNLDRMNRRELCQMKLNLRRMKRREKILQQLLKLHLSATHF